MKKLEILLLLILVSYCLNEDHTDHTDYNTEIPKPAVYSDLDSHSYSINSDYYFDPSNPSNNTVYEPYTKLFLLGFEKYQFIQKLISFNVIFKKIYGQIFPKKLLITIHIVKGILRNLEEEKETKTVICPRISNDNENNVKFFCSQETIFDSVASISADKNFSLVDENGNTYENLTSIVTGYANRTMGNVQNEIGPIKDFIILENSIINADETKFNVVGYISGNTYFIIEDNVTLSISDNENIKKIPCFISNNENSNFELECRPEQSISFHIDNVYGAISDKNLIISMKDNENDLINISISKNSYEDRKTSDKELTKGAIAGIVIGCVLTVVFLVIICVLLSRRAVKPPITMSQFDYYSNSSSQQKI